MEQERPLKERIWEFTKDLSVKVSRKAEKHWKINTLRVEIASVKHSINVKYKELGRFVYDAFKEETLEDETYLDGRNEVFNEIANLEEGIAQREKRIEELEIQMEGMPSMPGDDDMPPPPPPPMPQEAEAKADDAPKSLPEDDAEEAPAKAEAKSDEAKEEGADKKKGPESDS